MQRIHKWWTMILGYPCVCQWYLMERTRLGWLHAQGYQAAIWHAAFDTMNTGPSALRLGCSMPAWSCQDLSSRVVRLPGLSGSMRHELNLEPPHTSDFCKLTCANSYQVPGLPGVPCFALPWLPLSHLLKHIHGNENNLHGISPCIPSKFVGVISGTFILRS